jgi:hypothetical protein
MQCKPSIMIMPTTWIVSHVARLGGDVNAIAAEYAKENAFNYEQLKLPSIHLNGRYLFDEKAEIIVFPFNHLGTHWVIGCADLINNTFWFYDPQKKSHKLFQSYKAAIVRLIEKASVDEDYYPLLKRRLLQEFTQTVKARDHPIWTLMQVVTQFVTHACSNSDRITCEKFRCMN